MKEKQENRAESLLPEVLPDLIGVLNGAPNFGQCGIDIVFHDGRISRIVTRVEKSCKRYGGCEK